MFSKLKQFVGMVGITVELDIPGNLAKDASALTGTVRVIAKQDQHITRVTANMKQTHTEGSGEKRVSNDYEIGEIIITNQAFDIKAGETKEFPFTMAFQRRQSGDQRLAESGGVLGALGKFSTMIDNEQDEFWVNAMADVKGAALDPNDNKKITFN
jgi:hypothetical protein